LVLPVNFVDISRQGYKLKFDCRTKNASIVYERFTRKNIENKTDRSNCKFKEDELIPKIFRNTIKDFHRSGYDRGHLAPAADHPETFFLSNISPQNPNFNRGYWKRLEKHVRDYTKLYTSVDIFTGPLFLPVATDDGEKWVKYQVIGENEVAVPTHFFKVAFLDSKEARSFIVPNKDIPPDTPLDKFLTTLEKVEKASGFTFLDWSRQ
jgi:endonuclease G